MGNKTIALIYTPDTSLERLAYASISNKTTHQLFIESTPCVLLVYSGLSISPKSSLGPCIISHLS